MKWERIALRLAGLHCSLANVGKMPTLLEGRLTMAFRLAGSPQASHAKPDSTTHHRAEDRQCNYVEIVKHVIHPDAIMANKATLRVVTNLACMVL
jgi:hypothetical protein